MVTDQHLNTSADISSNSDIVPDTMGPQTVACLESSSSDCSLKCQPVAITVCDKPNQPSDSALNPVQNMGLTCKNGKPKVRLMNINWYKQYSWLHWDDHCQKLFCFFCLRAKQQNLFVFHRKVYEPTFTETGFCDWKNAIRAFDKHDKCGSHHEAVSTCESVSKLDVSAQLDTQLARDQQASSKALSVIISTLQYLVRQGLAIRGHTEISGNFYQLLLIRSQDVPEVANFLKKRSSFISHDIQNEIIQLMAHDILRSIIRDIVQSNSQYFSIIVDETTDASTKEQVSICLRSLNESLEPVEEFVGLYETATTTGATLSEIICDVLVRLALPISMLRGQCYDGASNMSGAIKGVRSRIQQIQPKAIYVHCFAHSLNLSVQDAVRSVPIVRDAMQCLRDLATIARGSAKRVDAFKKVAQAVEIDNPVSPRPLCPTRWTVRFAAIDAALQSYSVILPFLSEVAGMATVDDSASKANGLLSQFENGQMLFALIAAHRVFNVTDSLSCSMQSSKATVCGSMEAMQQSLVQLRHMRSDDYFIRLWQETEQKITEYGLHEIALPRHTRPPKRFDQQLTTTPAHTFVSAKDYFRVQYFAFVDNVLQHITERFDQPGMKMYCNMESALLLACRGEDCDEHVNQVCEMYDEFNSGHLKLQLQMLPSLCAGNSEAAASISGFAHFFLSKSSEVRSLFREVELLLKLLLVVPASSATAERSFSSLRRLKNYLRTTMSQSRLNHIALLNIHQERVDKLDIAAIQESFVCKSDSRRKIFGHAIKLSQ
jgi:hypothetical protein